MSALTKTAEANLEPMTGNYFVAAYPPFSAWHGESGEQSAAWLAQLPACEDVPWGLYVHVPFCERRCNYCYYLSFAGASRPTLAGYCDRLAREAAQYAALPRFAGRAPRYVYFGGGTPSMLPVNDLAILLARLQSLFGWQQAEEITFECSPQSIERQKLAILHAAGVNRLSLGVQQLDDEVLRKSGRIHQVADVQRAWREIRALDFAEVNIDLIAGLPGQTDATFLQGVEQTIALAPDSITIYQLEVPGNTPLFRALDDASPADLPADWETKRRRLSAAFELLQQHGYRTRNAYSLVRGQRHARFAYTEEQYRGADLVGIGLSAFSYVADAHFQNTTTLRDYTEAVNRGRLPITRLYRLSREERMVRQFVLQLKLGSVRRGDFLRKFGIDPVERFAAPLRQFSLDGWLTWDDVNIRLTAGGLVRVDRLLPAFYLPQHQTCSYW